MTVVTRFAPSPTGMLHIGGARTALFNLLFARRHGGKFLLRIEDTDKARSTQAATDAILDGLDWLGVTPDEPPVFQSEHADRHVACAQAMLEAGTAFKCFETQDALQARREAGEEKRQAAKAEGLDDEARDALRAEADALLAPFRSPWRDGGEPPAPDAPYTVRLRAPDAGEIVLGDAVQGQITIKAAEIDDLILLRADGTPTYMLAVVVDDHDMGVTHVIRGDDHLRNAFRQMVIYEGLGWDVPAFAHVALIHGSDGAKLSKRHGALSTTAYRDMGYLPEGLAAYLLRLGWSHGDQEIFTLDDAATVFGTEGLNKAPARLDLDKLAATNAHFIRACNTQRLFDLLLPYLEPEAPLTPEQAERIRAALPQMTDRGSTLPELAEAFAFLQVARPLSLNKKARKALKGDALDRLAGVSQHLRELPEWTAERIQQALDAFCAAQELSMGQIGPPLRAAATGGLPAPDLAPVLEWLGREETLARIQDQLDAGAAAPSETGE